MTTFSNQRTISGADTPVQGTDDGGIVYVTADATVTLDNTGWTVGRSAIAFEIKGSSVTATFAGSGTTVAGANGVSLTGDNNSGVAVYSGTNEWTIHIGLSASNYLTAANNLSDLASAATARTNLGVAIGSDVQAHAAVLDATTASFTTADETKLDGIETAATADQTGAQIKAAYEAEADTNAFTDADHSKLDGIEAAATADQTAADIRALGFFDTSNDGTGSGLDADTVDGNEASALLARANHTGTQAASTISDFDTQVRTSAPSQLTEDPPDVISGTTHTLVAGNHAHVLRATNAAGCTVTIPTDASDDLPDGFWCVVYAEDDDGVSTTTTGITTPGSPNTSIAQGEGILYMKTATANTWLLIGGTAA